MISSNGSAADDSDSDSDCGVPSPTQARLQRSECRNLSLPESEASATAASLNMGEVQGQVAVAVAAIALSPLLAVRAATVRTLCQLQQRDACNDPERLVQEQQLLAQIVSFSVSLPRILCYDICEEKVIWFERAGSLRESEVRCQPVGMETKKKKKKKKKIRQRNKKKKKKKEV